MATEPLVSVLMPVYNAGPYLDETIRSIIGQSYNNIELVIVNDASTDNSREIIFAFDDPRIRYFENEQNLGIVGTRNRCIDHARGAYFAIMDSDDIAVPDRISRQVAFLEENRDHGLCGTFFFTIDAAGKIRRKIAYPTDPEDIRTFLKLGNCIVHSTVMMRSEIGKSFRYVKGYDIVEDYELYYRVSQSFKIANIPVYSVYYRVHDQNITSTKKAQMFARALKIAVRILEDEGIKCTTEEAEMHLNFLWVESPYFSEPGRLDRLRPWVKQLMKVLLSDKSNNRKIVAKMIFRRWINLNARLRNFRGLLWAPGAGSAWYWYVTCLFQKAGEVTFKNYYGNDF